MFNPILHSERPKLHTVLAFLSAIELKLNFRYIGYNRSMQETQVLGCARYMYLQVKRKKKLSRKKKLVSIML